MKEIPLTRGLCAIVDDDDYECLSKLKWHTTRHRGRVFAISEHEKGQRIRMHHLLSIGVYSGGKRRMVRFANGNTLDCRRENLIPVVPPPPREKKDRPIPLTSMQYKRLYREKHRERVNAHERVRRAIRAGRLTVPLRCDRCQSIATVEGHHEDYSRPLNVRWLCRSCHRRLHRAKPEDRQKFLVAT